MFFVVYKIMQALSRAQGWAGLQLASTVAHKIQLSNIQMVLPTFLEFDLKRLTLLAFNTAKDAADCAH